MGVGLSWSKVFGEGVVIVASILLALAIESWWSERQARASAKEELADILIELGQARNEIEFHGAWHTRRLEATRVIRHRLEAAPFGTVVGVPDTSLAHLLGTSVADPPHSLLSAFVASGSLEHVAGDELRRGLLAWGVTLQDLQDDEVMTRNSAAADLWPYARDSLSVGAVVDLGSEMWSSPLTVRGGGEVPVRATQTLLNILSLHERYLALITRQAVAAAGEADALSGLVRAQLR